MNEYALVCKFTRVDGMRLLVGVTSSKPLTGMSVLLSKINDGEPVVRVFKSAEGCDLRFTRLVDRYLEDGYEFDGQVEIPVPPLELESSHWEGRAGAREWAEEVLNPAEAVIQVWEGMD